MLTEEPCIPVTRTSTEGVTPRQQGLMVRVSMGQIMASKHTEKLPRVQLASHP